MTRSVRILFSLAPAALVAPAQAAGPVLSNSPIALRVEHRLPSLGTDGTQRDVRLAERVYRQGNCVWVARELLPASVHTEHDHASPYAGHKHADTDTVPRWIECNVRGALTVRVASASQQKNYAVEPTEYSNIGFDGPWVTVYHPLDPAALKGMYTEDPACNGVQIYCSTQGERTVTVDWDAAGQYLRRVESRNATGVQRKLTCVTALPTLTVAPRERVQRYTAADYTDLMD